MKIGNQVLGDSSSGKVFSALSLTTDMAWLECPKSLLTSTDPEHQITKPSLHRALERIANITVCDPYWEKKGKMVSKISENRNTFLQQVVQRKSGIWQCLCID